MVSFKQLFLAAPFLLRAVAAAPFPDAALSVPTQAPEFNEFAVEARDWDDDSDFDIESDVDRRGLLDIFKKKKKPTKTAKGPTSTAGPTATATATGGASCPISKPRSLDRRYLEATTSRDIDEHNYILAKDLTAGETVNVINLSGCTALFFWNENNVPSVFHIFNGLEETDGKKAMEMVDGFGMVTESEKVTIVAADDKGYKAAEKGIRAAGNDYIQIDKAPYYDVSKTKNSSKRWKYTAVAGIQGVRGDLVEGCSREN